MTVQLRQRDDELDTKCQDCKKVKTRAVSAFDRAAESRKSSSSNSQKAAARVSVHCGVERPDADWRASERGTRSLHPQPRFAEQLKSVIHEFSWRISRSTKFRNCSLENCVRRLLSRFGRRTSNLKRGPAQVTKRKQCHGLKKSRWQIQSTILRRRDRFFGPQYPHFETLDTRVAPALKKRIQNSNFTKEGHTEDQKVQKEDSFFRGTQIALLIYEHFGVTGTHESILHVEMMCWASTQDRTKSFVNP